jgi:poly(beta-D-mannuronate) lyase
MRALLTLAFLVAGTTAAPIPARSAPPALPVLRSPWDANFPPGESDRRYRCPVDPPPAAVFSLAGYYKDASHSVIDRPAKRAYDKASAGIEGYLREVVRAADDFRSSGNREAAACALTLLSREADAHSLTKPQLGAAGSRQALYVQTWITAGSAIAYLKVRPFARRAEQARIGAWFTHLGAGVRSFQDQLAASGAVDGKNNLHAWGALAVAASGVAADNPRFLAWGIGAARAELGQVDRDGFLPLELARGRLALHYHLFTVAPLVILAELAQANGTNLYSELNGALPRLVNCVVRGLEDPSVFTRRTGVAAEPADANSGLTVSWIVPALRHMPTLVVPPNVQGRLEGYSMLGGLPPREPY